MYGFPSREHCYLIIFRKIGRVDKYCKYSLAWCDTGGGCEEVCQEIEAGNEGETRDLSFATSTLDL